MSLYFDDDYDEMPPLVDEFFEPKTFLESLLDDKADPLIMSSRNEKEFVGTTTWIVREVLKVSKVVNVVTDFDVQYVYKSFNDIATEIGEDPFEHREVSMYASMLNAPMIWNEFYRNDELVRVSNIYGVSPNLSGPKIHAYYNVPHGMNPEKEDIYALTDTILVMPGELHEGGPYIRVIVKGRKDLFC